MIHTPRRSAPPADLLRHKIGWTDRYCRICATGQRLDWATKAAKRILKPLLYALAHGKCVYCESALEVTGALEIEHYTPKTVTPRQAFEWLNLLPACGRCNNAKADEDHRGALLKPDVEDPEPFFWLHPDTGRLEPHPSLDEAQQARASETIRLCDLQRPALCTQRVLMLRRVGRWLERVSAEDALSPCLAREWAEMLDPKTEYKFVLRHALVLHGQNDLARLDRTTFCEGATVL